MTALCQSLFSPESLCDYHGATMSRSEGERSSPSGRLISSQASGKTKWKEHYPSTVHTPSPTHVRRRSFYDAHSYGLWITRRSR